jgi:hypothetical protein
MNDHCELTFSCLCIHLAFLRVFCFLSNLASNTSCFEVVAETFGWEIKWELHKGAHAYHWAATEAKPATH